MPEISARSARAVVAPSFIVVLVSVVLAACTPPAPDVTESSGVAESIEEVAEPAQEQVELEMWRHLGEVISADPHVPEGGFMSGHLADPKVGRLGDGTYLLTANRAEVADKGMLVFSSQNLTDWTLIHQVRENEAWFDQGFVGSFVTLDDGSVRMFYISRQMAIASATTPDGITWTRDPDWLIDQDDFGREVAISTLSVIPRTEGGWRMYILVEDCTLPNMQGSLHCQDEGGPPPPKETIAYTLVSAVSDDMLNWELEPGVRFQGSVEAGNLHHPHAWIAEDGNVRLSSQTGPPPNLAKDDWRIVFATISSDDGLTFGDIQEMSVPAADPFVIKTDDGRYLMFSSPNGDNQLKGIHAFELTTVDWMFEHPKIVDIRFDENGAPEPEVCITVTGKGEGKISLDMRSALNYWTPGSADVNLYELESAELNFPGEIHARILANRGEPNSVPTMLVATDESGVQWWLPFTTTGAPSPGAPCQFD